MELFVVNGFKPFAKSKGFRLRRQQLKNGTIIVFTVISFNW